MTLKDALVELKRDKEKGFDELNLWLCVGGLRLNLADSDRADFDKLAEEIIEKGLSRPA